MRRPPYRLRAGLHALRVGLREAAVATACRNPATPGHSLCSSATSHRVHLADGNRLPAPTTQELIAQGVWGTTPPATAPDVDFSPNALVHAAARCRERVHVFRNRVSGDPGVSFCDDPWRLAAIDPFLGSLPSIYPEWLGSRSFCDIHRVRFPYVSGAMAHGIASSRLVTAMARAELLAFFGSAGVPPSEVQTNIVAIQQELGQENVSWGADLIHSPHDPAIEDKLVELYLLHRVRRVSASAFMRLTPALVRYACTGLSLDKDGSIRRQNHLFAKLSRSETATLFMSPAPPELLSLLVRGGMLSGIEAELAARIPLAEDVTVEADSGGHTDNRPLTALLPTIATLRDELTALHRYARPIRIGAAGGIGTPSAVAAAYGLGAAYVMTGSINQSTVEAATSNLAKEMLAAAEPTDVAMAPSPDMFEMGAKVQVLKRGTLFASRAGLLRDLYRSHPRIEDIPAETMARLEREIYKRPLTEVWDETRRYFGERSPREVERAEQDPKHKMALVFRWYVGLACHWAIRGIPERKTDYQIWCGPAMGAFNRWVRGTFLAELDHRSVVQVALNLLEGAATVTRAQQLRCMGLSVPDAAFQYVPKYLARS